MNAQDKEELALYRAISDIDDKLTILAAIARIKKGKTADETSPGSMKRYYDGEEFRPA